MKNHPAWPLPLASVHLTAAAHRCQCVCGLCLYAWETLHTDREKRVFLKTACPRTTWFSALYVGVYFKIIRFGVQHCKLQQPDVHSNSQTSHVLMLLVKNDTHNVTPQFVIFLKPASCARFYSWLFFCVGGCAPLSGHVFFPLSQRRLVVRGLLYSARVVIALSPTVEGEGGGSGLSRWTVRLCIMGWWWEAETGALWGNAPSDFTSRIFFFLIRE